jgi:hypothetical protein
MNNVFPSDPEIKMDMVYDLKGSWVNRQVGGGAEDIDDEEWSIGKKKQKNKTLKDFDLNFMFLTDPAVGYKIGCQIDRDITFLMQNKIMDYSLLVGVRLAYFAKDEGDVSFERDEDTGCVSSRVVKGPDEYYFGIIDMLQEWNWGKWLENKAKTVFLFKDKRGVSAIEPQKYKDRFMARVVRAKIKGAQPERAGSVSDMFEGREMKQSTIGAGLSIPATRTTLDDDIKDANRGDFKERANKRQSQIVKMPRPKSGSWPDPGDLQAPAGTKASPSESQDIGDGLTF